MLDCSTADKLAIHFHRVLPNFCPSNCPSSVYALAQSTPSSDASFATSQFSALELGLPLGVKASSYPFPKALGTFWREA